jgi:hypothetical protein
MVLQESCILCRSFCSHLRHSFQDATAAVKPPITCKHLVVIILTAWDLLHSMADVLNFMP